MSDDNNPTRYLLIELPEDDIRTLMMFLKEKAGFTSSGDNLTHPKGSAYIFTPADVTFSLRGAATGSSSPAAPPEPPPL